jgi:hypothetical protein
MKPCYAAALALVGWYLISPLSPPYLGKDRQGVAEDAPLSHWDVTASYDSNDVEDCEKVLALDREYAATDANGPAFCIACDRRLEMSFSQPTIRASRTNRI